MHSAQRRCVCVCVCVCVSQIFCVYVCVTAQKMKKTLMENIIFLCVDTHTNTQKIWNTHTHSSLELNAKTDTCMYKYCIYKVKYIFTINSKEVGISVSVTNLYVFIFCTDKFPWSRFTWSVAVLFKRKANLLYPLIC